MKTVALEPYPRATALVLRSALEARELTAAQKGRLAQLFAELCEVVPMSALTEEHVMHAPSNVIFGTDGEPRLVVLDSEAQ